MSLCTNCHKREATLDWIGKGGVLDYVHGMSTRWCEQCAVEAQLAYARERAAEIPELQANLTKLLSLPVEPGPP